MTLPGILAEIAEAAGAEAALTLAQAKGGHRIRIPGHYVPGNWLEKLLGETAARAIIARFAVGSGGGRAGHTEVMLPYAGFGAYGQVRRATAQTFARAVETGSGVREAARQAGVTERTGWRMRRRMKGGKGGPDDAQGSLF